MSARQRGAFWLLMILLVGQLLDRLELPFEASSPSAPASADSSVVVPEAPKPGRPGAFHREPDGDVSGASGAQGDTLSMRIAINRAGPAELQGLPRVGPVLAARIIAERQENGAFHSIQDLQRVPGIGPRTAARLAPLLRFD